MTMILEMMKSNKVAITKYLNFGTFESLNLKMQLDFLKLSYKKLQQFVTFFNSLVIIK